MPVNFKIIDTKKYMWDGKTYESHADAQRTADIYQKDKFEIQIIQEESKHFVYTRREAVAQPEGQPPS